MGASDYLRIRYGRTPSEQRTNADDESDLPGRGPGAKGGKDGIAREQLAAKRLWELGFGRRQSVETHSGGLLEYRPLSPDRVYDRLFKGNLYRPEPIDQEEIRRMVRLALRKE